LIAVSRGRGIGWNVLKKVKKPGIVIEEFRRRSKKLLANKVGVQKREWHRIY